MNLRNQKINERNQKGMALVELLVAMLIGLVLVGGILQIFSSSRQTHRVHEATARMQESGRMALEVISRDVRMADFLGLRFRHHERCQQPRFFRRGLR